MLSWVRGFVFAVIVGATLGAVVSSTFVLNNLALLGVEISMADRASTALKDIIGFGPTYAAVLAGPLALLLGLAGFAARLAPSIRTPLMALAGTGAMAVVLFAIQALVGKQIVAGAREPIGFACECGVGLIAGLAFALVHRPARAA